MRSLSDFGNFFIAKWSGSKEKIPGMLDKVNQFVKNPHTELVQCDILEHIQYIVLYVYIFTLIAICIDRYRYIKYENVNIQARYSILFINIYIWLACTILVCIQKAIFKHMSIININPFSCKYEIKPSIEINFGLIIITDILPFVVVLSILLYTYTVFGILLYYMKIYSKRRWKRLTKKLREIDNIVEMSLKMIERNVGEDELKDEKIEDRKFLQAKENTGQPKLKRQKNESCDQEQTDETITLKEMKGGGHIKRSHTTSDTLATFARSEETAFDDSSKLADGLMTSQDYTSADSMSMFNTSTSLCEPLNLYRDDHSQSTKMLLKQHKIIVNVSELDNRIVIQTISQNVQDNSDYNLDMRARNENNTAPRENIEDILDQNKETLPKAVRSKYDELVNEELHLQRERAEELNMSFIMMLFFITVTFLFLWLPCEVVNYSQMLEEANYTRLAIQTTDIYEFNRTNVFNLCKSLNGICLFVFFYCMYKNFRIHFHAAYSRMKSVCSRSRTL